MTNKNNNKTISYIITCQPNYKVLRQFMPDVPWQVPYQTV